MARLLTHTYVCINIDSCTLLERMLMQANSVLPKFETPYLAKFKSQFTGLLRWSELDAFLPQLEKQTESQWYIYDLAQPPPQYPVSETEFHQFLKHINHWLRETHREDFCGVVYVDDKIAPGYIKIFHPKNMGHGTCSISKTCPLPGWVLSTIKPADLYPEQSPSSWWNNLPTFK